SKVESILIMVVLPAPFGPRTPKTSPSLTFRSIPSRPSTLPSLPLNSLRKPSTSTVDFASLRLINRETRLIPNKRNPASHLTIRPPGALFSPRVELGMREDRRVPIPGVRHDSPDRVEHSAVSTLRLLWV